MNERRGARVGRETLLALASKPAVQVILVATAAAQVASVATAGVAGDRVQGESPVATIEFAPTEVRPDSSLQEAWFRKAVLRESERLGSKYRSEGYNVSPQLAKQIGAAAAEFGIEPELAFGLVRAESSFRNAATSPVGAVGLTQLMPRTAAWMQPGVTRAQLRDPETNLRIGFMYLRYLVDKYEGDERLALLAYNRGPGTVDRELRRGRNPDNGYVDFVFGKSNHGHRLFTR